MTLLCCVIFFSLVFEFINGFHDTANSIATVVSTKVLTPRQAILLAASMELCGAMVGTAVAKTVASGLVDMQVVTSYTIICALLGAIIWNLTTWYSGLPSSSSHALVGGLCGAALASAHGDWGALIWARQAGTHWWQGTGLFYKVVLPMISSPLCGLLLGMLAMSLLYFLLRRWRPARVNAVFGKLQLASAAYMGFSHGSNDAQKTMGIIALALASATAAGTLDHLPSWLHFLRVEPPAGGGSVEIATWIKVMCAITIAAGTASGGWRIIRTLGHKMVKLQPVHGFAAETAAATVLMVAARLGMPVSTTHAISASIMGVGAAKRFNAIKWTVVEQILWAWAMTLPVSAALGWLLMRLVRACCE